MKILMALSILFCLSAQAEPPREDPHPRQTVRGRPNPHPHFGVHGEYINHPGYQSNFRYPSNWRPTWTIGVNFPLFVPIEIPAGYVQCTAFNRTLTPFPDYGPNESQAAWAALSYCAGGPNWQAAGCFIPPGYCLP
jgi:hypothetical protein